MYNFCADGPVTIVLKHNFGVRNSDEKKMRKDFTNSGAVR